MMGEAAEASWPMSWRIVRSVRDAMIGSEIPSTQTFVRRPEPRRRAATNPIERSLGGHLDHGFRPDIEGLRAIAVVASRSALASVMLYDLRMTLADLEPRR